MLHFSFARLNPVSRSNKGRRFLKQCSCNGGFTFIELVVVLFVITLITGILVTSYPKFKKLLDVEREAQLIALALRDAETRSVSTVRAGTGASATYRVPYGVHFNSTSGVNDRYFIFADTNSNPGSVPDFYDNGDLLLETVFLKSGTRIFRLCANDKIDVPPPSNAYNCQGPVINIFSITFRRPNPSIEVHGVAGGNPLPVPLGIGDFEIDLKTEDNASCRRVVVWTTGAVSVEQMPCP